MTNLNKNVITIPDDFAGFSPESFCVPPHYRSVIDNVLIPHGIIKDRIEKMAKDIFYDVTTGDSAISPGRPLHAVCVLKGGYNFFFDLLEKFRQLNNNILGGRPSCQVMPEFIRLKSYDGTHSTNNVRISGLEDEFASSLTGGKDLLVVEDMVDTGKTMKKLLEVLKQLKPRSIRVACLIKKRTPLSDGYIPDYVGFEIPDKYVIGYAFDYNENFRDLSHVCPLTDAGIVKYSSSAP